ncbi:MAG: M56 family metallopeptidase [Bacteroidota bacterium]
MSLYLLKIILGSGLLWLVYHFWLQNAKMFRFNRAYLILALLAAYLVPLLPLHQVEIDGSQIYVYHEQQEPEVLATAPNSIDYAAYLPMTLLFAWGSISLIFLIRFGKNLLAIWANVRRRRAQDIGSAKIIYLPEKQGPYTFGNYIFWSDQERESINPILLSHELAHVEQRHSWDILFVELLIILTWFNPFVYLFRRSIRLNHEFLADEAVVYEFDNRKTYPYLILQHASSQAPMALSSAFHYSNLKKRLSMITKKQSLGQLWLRKLSIIPLLGAFLFAFAGEALAQTPPPPPPPPPVKAKKTKKNIPPPPPPKPFSFDKPGYQGIRVVVKGDNGEESTLRFEDMTEEQKQKYLPPPPPRPQMKVPGNAEFQAWQDPKEYGVWLDGKRISNTELANYQANDIAMYYVSRLTKTAKNYGKHTYQLGAYTMKGYEKLLKEWEDNWGD